MRPIYILIPVAVAIALVLVSLFAPGVAGGLGFETAVYANVTVEVSRPQWVGDWGIRILNITTETKTVWTQMMIGPLWFWEPFEGTAVVESIKDGRVIDHAEKTFGLVEWLKVGETFTLTVKLGPERSGRYIINAEALDKLGIIVGRTDQRMVTI